MAADRLTDEQIADLARKHEAASFGVWVAGRTEEGRWLVRTEDGGMPYSVAEIPQARPGYTSPQDRAEAVFIAAAHELLPSLLAEVRASRAGGPAPTPAPAREDPGFDRALKTFRVAVAEHVLCPENGCPRDHARDERAARSALLSAIRSLAAERDEARRCAHLQSECVRTTALQRDRARDGGIEEAIGVLVKAGGASPSAALDAMVERIRALKGGQR